MESIAIFAHPEKPEAVRLAREAKWDLEADGADVTLSIDWEDDLDGLKPRLAVAFGGDGTVLGAVRLLGAKPPPIVAFNLGRLGYLAENHPTGIRQTIRDALDGKLQETRRIMIEGRILGEGGPWFCHALNEILLISRLHGRLLPVSVQANGEDLLDFRGDGLVMATPTGSTAYALSAGGPVVSPELSAVVLAPVCPHHLSNRSMVIDPNEVITARHFSDRQVDIVVDGKFRLNMQRGDTLEVRVARHRVVLLSHARGKYKLLREKLGWGWNFESNAAHGSCSDRR